MSHEDACFSSCTLSSISRHRTERGAVAGRSVGTRHLPRSNVGLWHVRDVTPAATRAAVIKGAAGMPA
jgi:hypothetical protein